MTNLIGINGFKGSGKNTAGNIVQGLAEARGLVVIQRAFAELMKLSAARCLGLATNINDAVVLMDCLKENGDILITIPDQTIMREITGREYLKWFGTEGHRDVFGDDFWVDLLLPLEHNWVFEWKDKLDNRLDFAVITDVRFANEARRIKEVGGVVWNIDRGLDGDGHVSEQPLPTHLVDLVIDNRSTLEALEINVKNAMETQWAI